MEFSLLNGLDTSNKQNFLNHFNDKLIDEIKIKKSYIEYKKQKYNLGFLYEFYNVILNCACINLKQKVAKEIVDKSANWMDKRIMTLLLFHHFSKNDFTDNFTIKGFGHPINNEKYNDYDKFILKNRSAFIDSFGMKIVNDKLLAIYANFNMDKTKDFSIIDFNEIKKDLKDLFGKEYDYYLNLYLIMLLVNNDDYINTYKYSLINILNTNNSILQSNELFPYYKDFIIKNIDLVLYKELYKAFEKQFQLKDVSLDYYDIKAFLEYKLGLKEKAIKTIQDVNSISVTKFKFPFQSKFKQFVHENNKIKKKSTN